MGEAEKSSTWAPEQQEQWSLYSAMIEEDRGQKKRSESFLRLIAKNDRK